MPESADEQDATIEDLQRDVLTSKKGKIFYGVKPEVLKTLLPGAKIRTFKEKERLFTQGTSSKNQFYYILLDATFSVIHIVNGYPVEIAHDRPGVIAADVENILRDIPAADYEREKDETDSYLSTVTCETGGKVLLIPETNMQASKDFQLAWNIATTLAIKLVQRNMPTDIQLTEEHDRIVGYLRVRLKPVSERSIKRSDGECSTSRIGRRVDVVNDTDVSYYDVRAFIHRYGLKWNGRQVVMPEIVFDTLMNDPVNLPAVGKSPGEMFAWRKSERFKNAS